MTIPRRDFIASAGAALGAFAPFGVRGTTAPDGAWESRIGGPSATY